MNQKTINENYLKIKGRFPIERKIELGEDIVLVIKAGCVKKEIFDNNDGTVDIVYLVKPIEIKFA